MHLTKEPPKEMIKSTPKPSNRLTRPEDLFDKLTQKLEALDAKVFGFINRISSAITEKLRNFLPKNTSQKPNSNLSISILKQADIDKCKSSKDDQKLKK